MENCYLYWGMDSLEKRVYTLPYPRLRHCSGTNKINSEVNILYKIKVTSISRNKGNFEIVPTSQDHRPGSYKGS